MSKEYDEKKQKKSSDIVNKAKTRASEAVSAGKKKFEEKITSGEHDSQFAQNMLDNMKMFEQAVMYGYQKFEGGILSSYKLIEDRFVKAFMTPEEAVALAEKDTGTEAVSPLADVQVKPIEAHGLLKGKHIIVTGGAGGIAAATIRAYVREGADVTVVDISDEQGINNVEEANALGGGKARYVHCDISNPDEVWRVFEAAEKEMGGLDVLAHIAAIETHKAAEDFTVEDMNFVWDVNIDGTIITNQAACKIMKKQGKGAIINYASDVAMTGMPNSALYAASKGANISWTRSVAHEWGRKYNIRANCVNPTIVTPMYEKWRAAAAPEVLKMHDISNEFGYPIGGGMGNADTDLAPVMVFLATDGAGYINGQVIPINGGANMVR